MAQKISYQKTILAIILLIIGTYSLVKYDWRVACITPVLFLVFTALRGYQPRNAFAQSMQSYYEDLQIFDYGKITKWKKVVNKWSYFLFIILLILSWTNTHMVIVHFGFLKSIFKKISGNGLVADLAIAFQVITSGVLLSLASVLLFYSFRIFKMWKLKKSRTPTGAFA